ncbi:MAG: class I SAM-dependent methyltransferase, partial [Planctomycetia bacterium]
MTAPSDAPNAVAEPSAVDFRQDREWLQARLVDPEAGSPLEFHEDPADPTGGVWKGPTTAASVAGGIPRFIADEAFVESFGFQWNAFDVWQPEEDAFTFTVKTGVPLGELAGLRVFDAGCGGGRYCRVAGENGAEVLGADRSRAVDKARRLTSHLPNVRLIQADLNRLPLADRSFDVVFSVGVLHHGPDTYESFRSIARLVKPGGRLSVWVYRRNTWPQEVVNDGLRAVARRTPRSVLLQACRFGAFLGGIPILNRTLNKVVSFSNHPDWRNRVCDTFDWYSPQYQHHHTPKE